MDRLTHKKLHIKPTVYIIFYDLNKSQICEYNKLFQNVKIGEYLYMQVVELHR